MTTHDDVLAPRKRSVFAYVQQIPTRWKDNDVYGHVNNVTYYSYFDTAVNTHLIREGGLDIRDSEVIGLVIETQCRFMSELTFPETIDAGVGVVRVGRSSVTYSIGLFRSGEDSPAAMGHFVHVYVDRTTRNPVAVPVQIRSALEPLMLRQEEERA